MRRYSLENHFRGVKIPIKIIFALFIIYLGSNLFASEEGSKEPSSEEKTSEQKKLPEWAELQNQITSLATKIEQKRENIHRLIEEKQNLPSNSPKVNEVIDEMILNHKELESFQDELSKKTIMLKFRYPERGAKEENLKSRSLMEKKTIEEMEEESKINKRLDRNMTHIRLQYGTTTESQKKKEENQKKNKKGKPDEKPTGTATPPSSEESNEQNEYQKPILMRK